MEKLLTTAETAIVLALSIQRLERHRADGTGPQYVKLAAGQSGGVRYRRADLEAWIASHLRAMVA